MTRWWQGDDAAVTVRASDNPPMHLLIPCASTLSDAGLPALRGLALPHLQRLLPRMTPGDRLGSDEYSLSTPAEQAHARLLGWQAPDGCLPWAAHAAAADGVATGDAAWGLLTPVHWHVGAEHVSVGYPDSLHLSAQESQALFEAVRPLFDGEGWQLAWGSPMRWYASHDSLDGLPTASLDRVIGRNLDLWMGSHPQARLIRRLQNEVQMLLYQQPLNDHRAGIGALPVNSFWLSGCGRAQPAADSAGLVIDGRLRAPLLGEDWSDWAEAWRALDAGPLRTLLERHDAGAPVSLTLCGERFAQRFDAQPQGWLARVARRFGGSAPAAVLEAL